MYHIMGLTHTWHIHTQHSYMQRVKLLYNGHLAYVPTSKQGLQCTYNNHLSLRFLPHFSDPQGCHYRDPLISPPFTFPTLLLSSPPLSSPPLSSQDNAIRHLTEKQSWLDLESHSSLLSSSRAASVAADHEALSDGYLSDSAMDDSKDKNKKKKNWKVRVQSAKVTVV